METIENNKLIAEFMGFIFNPYDGGKTVGINAFIHENGEIFADDWKHPNFAKSWDWLMPVVEKIDDMFTEKYSVSVVMESLNQSIITIHFHQPDQTKKRIVKQFINTSESKISSLYKTIVEFIIWYNNPNK